MNMDILAQRLQAGPPLILDGATGTQLEARGVPSHPVLWSAAALETHPQVVQAIHADYLRAGAEIITTNTFRTHTRNVGDRAQARALTQKGVALARAAVDEVGQGGWVAGCAAPLDLCFRPDLTPDPATCYNEHVWHTEHLAEAGVDLILIETMNTAHEATAAARSAHALGLPFMVSYVLRSDFHLLSGESLDEAIAQVAPYAPLAVLVNCIPTRHVRRALEHLRSASPFPIGAYGNMNNPQDLDEWAREGDYSPQDYAACALDWVRAGARVVGACCGSGAGHIAALYEKIREK